MSIVRPEFTPKLFSLWKAGIPREQLRKDVVSGVIVGIVALPLAIAFAIASGVPPEKGLITAIVAGLTVSVLGGSRVQIGGPTGAFIVIVYGIVQQHGVEGLIIATFMAGIMLVLLGLLRAGELLKFFPHTLIVGFTAGIALIILTTQVKELLGLHMEALPSGTVQQWMAYAGHLDGINPWAVGIAALSIALILGTPRITRFVPGPLAAIIVCTALAWGFQLPVESIAGRFGAIPQTLPMPHVPHVDLATLRELVQPAVAIALLGAIESLLSAVVADGMIGGRHRSDMELIAQGGGNMLSALFGGIPATGAIARTATNVKNGGRTPVAGIVHALTLLVIMLVFAPLAGRIPLPCLAGILVVVAYNMSEWRSFLSALKGHRYDALVLLVTFFITVVFDLVLAIEVGMVLAAFLFVKRMSDITDLKPVFTEGSETEEGEVAVPAGVRVFDVSGPLFFGAAQKFQDVLTEINDRQHLIIIRLRHVPMVDGTGLHRIGHIVHQLERQRKQVVITDAAPSVEAELRAEPWFREELLAVNVQVALGRMAEARNP
ncbi:MAG: STAS domain-containing protein [Flavobacteriales bacterium]|nr:STAS domain-containing protein [Flavobacteriales bacterium]MBL0034165.1 STAS domain-containing protein [Flavobacteriales bacterium]